MFPWLAGGADQLGWVSSVKSPEISTTRAGKQDSSLPISFISFVFFFFFGVCLLLPISKQAPPLGKNVTSSFYGRTGTKNLAPK